MAALRTGLPDFCLLYLNWEEIYAATSPEPAAVVGQAPYRNSRAAMQFASPNFRKSFPFSASVPFGDADLHRLPISRVGQALPPANPEVPEGSVGKIPVTPMDSMLTPRKTDGSCRNLRPGPQKILDMYQ